MLLENIVQILFTLVCLYIIYKFLSPVLMEIFSEKVLGQKLNQEHDIDEMIRKKKAQIQSGHHTQSLYGEQELKQLYQEMINDPNSAPELKEDAKTIFKVLNDTQWGESQEIKKWTQSLSHKYGIELQTSVVFKEVLQILQGKYHTQKTILTVKEVKKILQYSVMLNEFQKKESPLTKMMAKKSEVPIQSFLVGVYLAIQKLSQNKNLDNVIKENGQILSGQFSQIPDLEQQVMRLAHTTELTPDEFTQAVYTHAKQARSLCRLTTAKEIDIDEALNIFGYSSIPSSTKQVELKHKELRKIYHPDKMAHLKLPPKIEKIATENYQVIQKAYEIIMKKIK